MVENKMISALHEREKPGQKIKRQVAKTQRRQEKSKTEMNSKKAVFLLCNFAP